MALPNSDTPAAWQAFLSCNDTADTAMDRGPRLLFGVFMRHSLSGYIAVMLGFHGEPLLLGAAVFEFVGLGCVIAGAGVSTEVVAVDR